VRKEGLAKLENHRRGRVGSHSQERQEEHAGFFQNLYNKISNTMIRDPLLFLLEIH
jgi:hypothetical protein